MKISKNHLNASTRFALTLGASVVLTACGGGGSDTAQQPVAISGSSGTGAASSAGAVSLVVAEALLPADIGAQVALPTFHVAPEILDEPSDVDATDNGASARSAPHTQSIPAAAAAADTRGLTVQSILASQREHALDAPRLLADGTVAPLATASVAVTFTPAQIRAAYSLPSLPSASLTPTAAQAAQSGAGQTIYIIDAMHDPNAAAELAAFNSKFGLPTCTTKAIAAGVTLPLPLAPVADGCTFSVVYSTPAGGMTPTAPAYDSGWATEIALDLQWVHATAPRARIVLIESADASLNGLLGAVKLANAMGSGAVSMSFGSGEGSWTASVDPAFAAPNMTYVAATGDSGSAVSWPAVSPNVLAVGGTSLSYSGTGNRSESSWNRTGGAISAYTATPAYQSNKVPGVGTLAHRAVADVSFNADPYTGQYVAVISPGSSVVNWISAGGTSLSTPQWAGLVAVGNAMRVQAGKAMTALPHAALYTQIAQVPGTYAAAFADVLSGSNGTCATCAAKVGYDIPTGLGTPNGSVFLSAFTGVASSPVAPIVTGTAISAKSGVALSFNVTSSDTDPTTCTIANAPTGMVIAASTGVVTWPKPLTGTYAVTATVKDTKSGLSGSGVYTVKVDAPPVAPVVASTTVNGKAAAPLSYLVSVTAATANSFSLAGAPSGMAIDAAGNLAWANPVAGTYSVTVTAANTSSGLSGKGVLTVVIAKSQPPVVTANAITGLAGKPVSGSITVSDPAGSALQVNISGVPPGGTFSVNGQTLLFSWANPVAGKYGMTIVARDAAGLATTATMPITINAK